jgi:hypothetical protein
MESNDDVNVMLQGIREEYGNTFVMTKKLLKKRWRFILLNYQI